VPTPGEPFRVAVYCDDEEQRQRAEEALRAVRPEKVTVFSGVVEGWIRAEGYRQLVGEGLIVDVTDPASSEEAEPDAPLLDEHAETPDPDAVEQFKAQARRCALDDEAGFIFQEDETEPDPRIHPETEVPAVDVFWVRFKRPLSPDHREDLERRGIEIVGYQPPNTYKIFLTEDQVAELKALPYVAAIDRYTFEQTVTPHLVEAAAAAADGPQLLADDGGAPARETYDCVLHRSRDADRVRAILDRTEGATVVSASGPFIRFDAPAGAPYLAALAHLPEVRKLAQYVPPRLLSDCARRIVGIERVDAPVGTWTGAGELVGIFDSGVDDTHPDLAGRIHSVESYAGGSAADTVGHGTHVAGIIAGDGTASGGAVRGMAPGSKLICVRVTDDAENLVTPPDLGELLARATDKGAKIINLSWGTPLHGDYDLGSLSLDRFVAEHPDVLVVVAAGNAGEAPQGYVAFGRVFAPASGKNVLTVGASATDRAHDPALSWGTFRPPKFPAPPSSEEAVCGDANLPAAISSRGPTDFDSVKPDVLAPGTFILAPRASGAPEKNFWETYAEHEDKYAFLGGTSMAAPVVTGAAAVLRQYLREERPELAAPSSALLKAILLASAIKLPTIRPPDQQAQVGYPDFDQGFGRIDLSRLLPVPGAAGRRVELADIPNDSPEALESRVPLGAERKSVRTHVVEVADGAAELRIVLAWTDRPGRYMQNNLELDVRGPGGARQLGNAEHTYRKNALFDDPALTGSVFDKRNNVEHVALTNPAPGRYRVRVWAENTLSPQGYALCVVGDLSSPMTVEA